MKRKKCSKCQQKMAINQFAKNENYTLGVVNICMSCINRDYNRKNEKMRPCLGVHCRGKLFKSKNGARLCVECRNAIRNNGDTYQEQIIILGRSKIAR